MNRIPADILISIVGHVSRKSDLKSLCQTSKQWHDLAVPQLYHDIEIWIWRNVPREADRFLVCVSSGARQYLRFTRKLTIELTGRPRDPHSCDIEIRRSEERRVFDTKKDQLSEIGLILEVLPRDVLFSFWLIQDDALPWKLLRDLTNKQTRLQSLITGVGNYPWLGEDPQWHQIHLANIQTLDLCLHGNETLFHSFQILSIAGVIPQLKRLEISFNGSEMYDPGQIESFVQTSVQSGGFTKLSKLQELGLFDINRLDVLLPWLLKVIDFGALERFSFGGYHESAQNDFLLRLGESLSSTGAQFRRLDITSIHGVTGLAKLLNSCDRLVSLHIKMSEVDLEDSLVEALVRLGPSLDSFALCEIPLDNESDESDENDENDENDWPLRNDEKRLAGILKIYQSCYNVRYLGCPIKPKDLTILESIGSELDVLAPFHAYEHLRVIAFPYGISWEEMPLDLKPKKLAEISQTVKRFATAAFTFFNERQFCLELKGIVFGTDRKFFSAREEYHEEYVVYEHPRQCFMKGSRIDDLGRATPIAIPVLASRLEVVEPDCDLLDSYVLSKRY